MTVIAALAAFSARETYRIHMDDLGQANALPVAREEYERMRAQSIADDQVAKAVMVSA